LYLASVLDRPWVSSACQPAPDPLRTTQGEFVELSVIWRSSLLIARLAFESQVPSRLVFTVAAETLDKIAPIPSVFS
jgi:hypothetical protein